MTRLRHPVAAVVVTADSVEVTQVIEAHEREIALQRTYRDFVSYGVYVATKA